MFNNNLFFILEYSSFCQTDICNPLHCILDKMKLDSIIFNICFILLEQFIITVIYDFSIINCNDSICHRSYFCIMCDNNDTVPFFMCKAAKDIYDILRIRAIQVPTWIVPKYDPGPGVKSS